MLENSARALTLFDDGAVRERREGAMRELWKLEEERMQRRYDRLRKRNQS